ncbi:hypothetical protein [Streptomyces yangpuensis]|uniref:hypothetical protein n=1 Tax=Streptomyces yangpuensis TaxID=1648182 RepID=UPI0012FEF266|nr:hypothetical protein [Streptomyces yangpuensis]
MQSFQQRKAVGDAHEQRIAQELTGRLRRLVCLAVGRMATRAAVGAVLCPSLVRSVTGSPSGKERAERKISSMERQLTQFGTPVQYGPRLAGRSRRQEGPYDK